MKRRRRTRPVAVGPLIPRVLHDLGLDSASVVIRIAECWDAAVGPEIAQHCRPTALRGAVLEATVDSSVWCQQIQLRRGEILAALGEALGPDAPSDLRLRLG